ncbi:hypothetical protein VA249_46040 (plasmid) [Vibrio alfacsensis]|nr:hypothetical protein VA249_46040 [Vibrio alfacsensis]
MFGEIPTILSSRGKLVKKETKKILKTFLTGSYDDIAKLRNSWLKFCLNLLMGISFCLAAYLGFNINLLG